MYICLMSYKNVEKRLKIEADVHGFQEIKTNDFKLQVGSGAPTGSG